MSDEPVLPVGGTDFPMLDTEDDVLSGGEADVADCLMLHESTFNPRWSRLGSVLDRCVSFFENVTSTTAAITSFTNSNITGEFQRDFEHFDKLKDVEEMREVLCRWMKRFREMRSTEETVAADNVAGDVAATDGDQAMDVDTPNTAEAPDPEPRPAGVKRQREQDEADEKDWRKGADVLRTRLQTTLEAKALQPFQYVEAKKVINGVDFLALKRSICSELNKFVDEKDDYWPPFQPDPKLWRGCSREVKAHVKSLKIPSVPLQSLSLPDMLLYCLGRLGKPVPGKDVPPLDPEFEARIRPLLDATDWDYFLQNAAGVGKTRLMFELLVRRFGLYLNFAHDSKTNPYGSRDAMTAHRLLERGRRNIDGTDILFRGDIKDDDDVPDIGTVRSNNETIVAHLYQLLIYARVLVFDWFLSAYKRRTGGIDATAIRLWCLLQIRPLLWDAKSGIEVDVFDTVFRSILTVSMSSCSKETKAILSKWNGSELVSMTFLILDEVNEPSQQYPVAFKPANPSHTGGRPLLKAVLHAVREPFDNYKTRVLVASTAFNETLIKGAIGSSTMKLDGRPPRPFTEFGDYSDPSSIENTLLHFFGPSFVTAITKVMRGHIDFWFTARRRFLCTYIQWVLHQGPSEESLINVMRQLVNQATGNTYAGEFKAIAGFSFHPIVPKTLTDKPGENATLIMKLQHAVVYFIIKGRFPSYAEDMREIVTHGQGRFVPQPLANGREVVTIRESLTLASLMAWVHKAHGDTPLTTFLDMAMSTTNEKSRGFAFEDVVMFVLWQAFTDKEGIPLDKIFNFRYLPPAWKGARAKLVQILKRSSDNNRSHTLTPGVTTRIGYEAKSPEDTLSWFSDPGVRKARIPFLQPDHLCGPDLMLVLLVDGVELLVCVQCKCWTTKHSPGALRPALIKLTPEGFYSDKKAKTTLDEPARSALEKALKEFKAPNNRAFMPKHDKLPEAKLKILRVLAVFDQSISWPSFDASFGCYPIASLSREFITSTKLKFSAFERAYQMASLRANEGEPFEPIK